MKCDLCGRAVQFGHNVSHSKRHTKRRWVANIHPAKVAIDGKTRRVYLCTRCLRTQSRAV
ncbi:MAG: 50S ribosomal protein L28 [Dehalococcoidales bacterium]|nr:50S ribosomal protein L28 [Dehalococcoidales bacterium]